VFINSKNDQWGCNEKFGLLMHKKLGGDLVLTSDQGHFGSDKYDQPYKEFPLLKFFVETEHISENDFDLKS